MIEQKAHPNPVIEEAALGLEALAGLVKASTGRQETEDYWKSLARELRGLEVVPEGMHISSAWLQEDRPACDPTPPLRAYLQSQRVDPETGRIERWAYASEETVDAGRCPDGIAGPFYEVCKQAIAAAEKAREANDCGSGDPPAREENDGHD